MLAEQKRRLFSGAIPAPILLEDVDAPPGSRRGPARLPNPIGASALCQAERTDPGRIVGEDGKSRTVIPRVARASLVPHKKRAEYLTVKPANPSI